MTPWTFCCPGFFGIRLPRWRFYQWPLWTTEWYLALRWFTKISFGRSNTYERYQAEYTDLSFGSTGRWRKPDIVPNKDFDVYPSSRAWKTCVQVGSRLRLAVILALRQATIVGSIMVLLWHSWFYGNCSQAVALSLRHTMISGRRIAILKSS